MNIALPKSHADWLQARVDDGTFASMDDAVVRIVEERMEDEVDDTEWTELLASLDAARDEVASGKFLTLDEHRARNAERLARLRNA